MFHSDVIKTVLEVRTMKMASELSLMVAAGIILAFPSLLFLIMEVGGLSNRGSGA